MRRNQRSAEAAAYRHLYNNKRWRRLREQQLRREPCCRMCAQMGKDEPATVCDHVEPHKGDPVKFWQGPFQSLCARCDARFKQRLERGRETKAIGDDGWPVDG